MINEPTDEQKLVINTDGNIVVTAKPGSGKTYTIVEKIAYILPQLPEYKGVIAISFTNKASDELRIRCKKRCENTKQSFFGTIDKFYISQIIIPFASHITGKMPDYEVVSEISNDKYSELKNVHDPLTEKEEKLLLEALSEGLIFLQLTGETALLVINKAYGALKYLKARYSHIVIDEYQDCGKIQHAIFTMLVQNGFIGIAVGDINQAIYGFSNRFPRYLISLIGMSDFSHFQLNQNHRCHDGISEYSLCLLKASNHIPEEKRVFKVSVEGNERDIAFAIDSKLDEIKKNYGIINNNQCAILCRSNISVSKISENLSTPHKIFSDTDLDKDNSEWGRFFNYVLISRFKDGYYAVDLSQELFSEEYESSKYLKALNMAQSIFSCAADELESVESEIINLAKLVYPEHENDDAINKLQKILKDKTLLQNYYPPADTEINIMTLHKSKGLEFSIVFHLDLYRWVFPNEYASDEDKTQDLNLHYVGVTRAKEACYIINGTSRYRKKNDDYIYAEPSPFLDLPGLEERSITEKW